LLPAYVIVGGCTYLAGLRLLKAVHPVNVELARQAFGKRYEFPLDFLSKILQI